MGTILFSTDMGAALKQMPIVRLPHQARLDWVQIDARQLKKKNRSDKTNLTRCDMPAHYTAVERISKRKAGGKAAESLKRETLRYPAGGIDARFKI